MRLWSIGETGLTPVHAERLESEDQLENWLERDIGMLDPDLIVIGRQVVTPHGGRIDLLAMSSAGSVFIVELKRDRTPRDIVAQVLDYASWVGPMDTVAVHEIADAYWRSRGSTFLAAFQERFGTSPPDGLNLSHNMVIVASALDPASQRIVEYLAQVHDIGINTAFFTVFGDGERRFLSADWLMDQKEVTERTERRVRAPWTGRWYVNAGDGPHRSWEDMRRFGFVAAGGGRIYSGPLEKLSPGDRIYVYQKARGYVGYGEVTAPAVLARDAVVGGRRLLDCELREPNIGHDPDDEENAEYVVAVDWLKAFPLEGAKTAPNIFSNQWVVCKLRDPLTLSFLEGAFEV